MGSAGILNVAIKYKTVCHQIDESNEMATSDYENINKHNESIQRILNEYTNSIVTIKKLKKGQQILEQKQQRQLLMKRKRSEVHNTEEQSRSNEQHVMVGRQSKTLNRVTAEDPKEEKLLKSPSRKKPNLILYKSSSSSALSL